jgi:hypothetical protein
VHARPQIDESPPPSHPSDSEHRRGPDRASQVTVVNKFTHDHVLHGQKLAPFGTGHVCTRSRANLLVPGSRVKISSAAQASCAPNPFVGYAVCASLPRSDPQLLTPLIQIKPRASCNRKLNAPSRLNGGRHEPGQDQENVACCSRIGIGSACFDRTAAKWRPSVIHPKRRSQGWTASNPRQRRRRCAPNNAPGGRGRSGCRCCSRRHGLRPRSSKWHIRVSLTHPLPATSKSLARSGDGVYRESTRSLVGARVTRESRLPAVGLINFDATKHYDRFRSDGISRLEYEYVTRLYSETARRTFHRKSNRFDVIVSIWIIWNAADGVDHGLSSADSGPHHCAMEVLHSTAALYVPLEQQRLNPHCSVLAGTLT